MFKNFIADFKQFLLRGNVIDLAVAFVIGAAFSAIVKSLVDNIIMAPIGLLLHNVDFSNLYIILKPGSISGPYLTLGSAEKAGAVTLNYGLFINSVVNFVIIAFAVFLLLRVVNKLYSKPIAPAITKVCPYCATDIPIDAKRCPHCTSQLEI